MVKEEEEQRGTTAAAITEARLEDAMLSRIQYFQEQASSLTLGSVRRLLEEDLGLEKYALDGHKKLIRQILDKHMDNNDNNDASKDVGESEQKAVLSVDSEAVESSNQQKIQKDIISSSNDAAKKEDSPIMGLLSVKSELADDKDTMISESTLKKAIQKRADHILSNSETLSLAGVRRLLEGDLGLDKNSLDPFKKFISKQIDKLVVSEASRGPLKNSSKAQSNSSEKISNEGNSYISLGESDEVNDREKSTKKAARKGNTERPNKRKEPMVSGVSGKKPNKLVRKPSEEISDTEDDGSVSEGGQAEMPAKHVKKKEVSAPGYGKHIEHLKSVIKSCGMSIAPSVYKKAKQAPENKREAVLKKELEGILSREGLSPNPSEKEIKEVRKRKQREKELEGIDMSNIVSSSRRRSTASFMTPAKPKVNIEVVDSNNNTEGSVDKNDNDVSSKDSDNDDDDDEDDEEIIDDSQSEEFNEDDDEDSD